MVAVGDLRKEHPQRPGADRQRKAEPELIGGREVAPFSLFAELLNPDDSGGFVECLRRDRGQLRAVPVGEADHQLLSGGERNAAGERLPVGGQQQVIRFAAVDFGEVVFELHLGSGGRGERQQRESERKKRFHTASCGVIRLPFSVTLAESSTTIAALAGARPGTATWLMPSIRLSFN